MSTSSRCISSRSYPVAPRRNSRSPNLTRLSSPDERDRGLHKAHRAAPIFGILEKIDDLPAGIFRKVALTETGVQDVVPVRQNVQGDIIFGQIVFPLVLL